MLKPRKNKVIEIPKSGTDPNGNVWIELKIRVPGGTVRRPRFALADINVSEEPIRRALGDAGIHIASAREELREALDNIPERRTFRVARAVGWHELAYMTPHKIYGDRKKELRTYLPVLERPERWKPRGTLKAWRAWVRGVVKGNDLLTFGLSVAFVGPLLRLLSMEGAGFMHVGPTSTGKSAVAHLLGSVWGGDPNHQLGFLDTFLFSPEGIERLAKQARDGFLVLDETKLAARNSRDTAEHLAAAIFRFASGTEKIRYGQDGQLAEWRIMYWSTSNDTARTILARGNKEFDESYSVRLIEIPVFGKYGAFDRVPENMTPAEFADQIKQMAQTAYGSAIDKYLRRITSKDREALVAVIRNKMALMRKRLRVDSADGPVARVAEYFCVAYAAGRLAQKFGILPKGRRSLRKAVERCYLEHRRHVLAVKAKSDPVEAVRQYIVQRHLDFIQAGTKSLSDEEFDSAAGFIVQNKGGECDFCFSPQKFAAEFGLGGSIVVATAALAKGGLLIREEGKNPKTNIKKQIRAKGGRDRVVCVSGRILPRSNADRALAA